MVKDSKRFSDSGGWGYAEFEYDAASDTFRPGTLADQAAAGERRQVRVRVPHGSEEAGLRFHGVPQEVTVLAGVAPRTIRTMRREGQLCVWRTSRRANMLELDPSQAQRDRTHCPYPIFIDLRGVVRIALRVKKMEARFAKQERLRERPGSRGTPNPNGNVLEKSI